MSGAGGERSGLRERVASECFADQREAEGRRAGADKPQHTLTAAVGRTHPDPPQNLREPHKPEELMNISHVFTHILTFSADQEPLEHHGKRLELMTNYICFYMLFTSTFI